MTETIESILVLLRNINENLTVLNLRLLAVEDSVRILRSTNHETKLFVKRGYDECKKMLACCREGYRNVLEVSEMQLEETTDLANSVSCASDWA